MKIAVFGIIAIVAISIIGSALFCNIRASQAQGADMSTAVMEKLQEIIQNQQTILQKLDAMTRELNVIKIRATKV